MSQIQSNRERFAGPNMIQENDHLSQIPQVQDQNKQGRQSDQSQGNNRQADGKRNTFEYQNPRQVY